MTPTAVDSTEKLGSASCGEDKKTTSSVDNLYSDSPPFGSRYLTAKSDVWSKNAWDHVPAPDDQQEKISTSLNRQRTKPVPEVEKSKYNDKPAKHWDNFYKMNTDNFFRDRKWLHTEFPELVATTQPDAGQATVVELGCGAGNSVFPLLASNQNPLLRLYAYDYSSHAVKLVQHNPLYKSPPAGTIHASVWDITSSDGLPDGIEPCTADIVILIFVLSALHPNEWSRTISNIYRILKPGGLVVLRDYGRYDLTQLRFKENRLLDDNFYIRGDKTRVYFFELDELALLFTGSPAQPSDRLPTDPTIVFEGGEEEDVSSTPSTSVQKEDSKEVQGPDPDPDLEPTHISPDLHTDTPISTADSSTTCSIISLSLTEPPTSSETQTSPPTASSYTPLIPSRIHPVLSTSSTNALVDCPPHPLFVTEQLGVDRRLLINRKRQLKMYRVWMQGKFRKLESSETGVKQGNV